MPDATRLWVRPSIMEDHCCFLGRRKTEAEKKGLKLKQFVRPTTAARRRFLKYRFPGRRSGDAYPLYWDIVRKLWIAQDYMYVEKSGSYDQQIAHDHYLACVELDKTDAGRKARQLLFSFLNEAQIESYLKYWYFYEVPQDEQMRGIGAKFRIERGYPNGNVKVVGYNDQEIQRLCFHPDEPYPTDDIILGQILLLREKGWKGIYDIANPSKVRGRKIAQYG